MPYFSSTIRISLLSAVVASCAHAQPSQPQKAAIAEPRRTLIVSGGPNAQYNQYAIESNARYVEKLTAKGQQRILFANGNRQSRTISTLEMPAHARELVVLSWLLDEYFPSSKTVMKAPTLKRLDGSATPQTIVKEVTRLAKIAKSGERGLIYFTGHGSEGRKFGFFGSEDYDNTHYSGWGGDLAMRELAPSLQSWPSDGPLTLVMVQCHSGGFANLIWKDGDAKNGIWPRDFCGFFATTGDRMASGCTSEVDEREYQDFTTHFFAALSGISRDGRPITGADFDHNGAVSGLEALAYTNLHDDSIDVPVCTSDLYLRQNFAEPSDSRTFKWMKTPYSTVLKDANSWQKAILSGLTRDLKLSGETRLETAYTAQKNANRRLHNADEDEEYNYDGLTERQQAALSDHYYSLEEEILRRFPALKSKKSRYYAASKTKAIAFLRTRPVSVEILYNGAKAYYGSSDIAEKREAKLCRFLRTAYTVVLQKRLEKRGTVEQKAVFARLRASEGRNFLK